MLICPSQRVLRTGSMKRASGSSQASTVRESAAGQARRRRKTSSTTPSRTIVTSVSAVTATTFGMSASAENRTAATGG